MMQRHRSAALTLSVVLLTCRLEAATAPSADQFFKGKVINLYIGFATGGT